jgi:hypothetical protein
LSAASSLFAANPADLTVFERFAPNNYMKLIYEEDGKTGFLSLPPIGNDFVVSVQAWQNQRSDSEKYTGRLIKRFSPNFDAALMTDFISKKGVSDIDSRLVLDLHGDLFGLPAGIGLYLPFDEQESVKMGPRIGISDFTVFTTVAKEGKYLFGATYAKTGCKVEVAYSTEEVFYVRASKGFKTSIGRICPEIRMRFLPNDQIFGVGLGIFF